MSRIFAPIIPGEDMVSGAQVIDGSLKFDKSSLQCLQRYPSSNGNLTTWTWSGWAKLLEPGQFSLFGAGDDGNDYLIVGSLSESWWYVTGENGATNTQNRATPSKVRDSNAWYHVVSVFDFDNPNNEERWRLYVNGKRVAFNAGGWGGSQGFTGTRFNRATYLHSINAGNGPGGAKHSQMSQITFVDGQALGPGYFGFTDPLTGTWRPRRLRDGDTTVNDGTTWSSYGSITAGTANGTTSQAFDGDNVRDVNADGITTSDGNLLTWTFTTPIKYKQTFEVAAYGNGYGTSYLGEGTADPSTSGKGIVVSDITTGNGVPFYVIAEGGGAVQSISIRNSSERVGIVAIRVDGVIMTDATTTNIDFGTNGYYLPLDGSKSVGEDQSGKGNDWTPVNFGGSMDITKATGALPILNTVNGGNVATVGVRSVTDGFTSIGVNDGTVWSSTTNGNFNTGISRGADKAFNGSVGGTDYAHATTGTTATVSDLGITGISTIRVNIAKNNTGDNWGTFALDSTDLTSWLQTNYGSTGNTGTWIDVTSQFSSSTLDSISITTNSDGVTDVRLAGVEINGETLVDGMGLRLALPLVGNAKDVSNQINSGSTTNTVTVTGAVGVSTNSNFYGGSFSFGSGDTSNPDYLDLGDTGFAFNNNSWTMEVWVYARTYSNGEIWFSGSSWASNRGDLLTMSGTGVAFYQGSGGSLTSVSSSAVPLNSWHHIALSADGTNVTMYVDGISQGSVAQKNSGNGLGDDFLIGAYRDTNYQADPRGGFQGQLQDFRVYIGTAKYTSNFIPASTNPDILPDTPSGVSGGSKLTKVTDGSVAFDGGDNTNLSIADSTDFDHASAFTWEGYFYLKSYDSSGSSIVRHENDGLDWYINTSGNIIFNQNTTTNIVSSGNGVMTLNKWVHIAVSHTGSVCKMFVDGIEKASATTSTVPDNVSGILYIGETGDNNNYQWNGFISNLRFVNGTALYTSAFTPPAAPLTDVTNTKLLCCQSTTSATAAAVTPGSITANGNAAATTLNPFTTDINTVRGQESGYATLNPLYQGSNSSLSDGNLRYLRTANGYSMTLATMSVSSGKWYYEHSFVGSQNNAIAAGIVPSNSTATYPGEDANSVGYNFNGTKVINTSQTSYGATYDAGDVVGVAFDADNGTVEFYKNGVNQGTATSALTSGPYTAGVSGWGSGTGSDMNFGQKPFKYAPPEGFQPLSAANVRPSTVIARPDQYVGIVTYIGNGSDGHSITGFGHSPDLLLVKARNQGYDWMLHDTVRGKNINLRTNVTNADNTDATNVTSFDSDGFTTSSGSGYMNGNNVPFVAYSWKAGGAKFGGQGAGEFWKDGVQYASASAAGLTAGTITPTAASVGTKQGFSIIAYEGTGAAATVSHGLSNDLSFIIVKDRDNTYNWACWHSGLSGNDYYLFLNNTDGQSNSYYTYWNNTAPTSSVFSLGANSPDTAVNTNKSGDKYIAYCWADVPGLQKFGSFEGNADANGPFVELGFRPAVVIWKCIDASSAWTIEDGERSKYNVVDARLFLDDGTSGGNETSNGNGSVDFLSNGFKIRTSHAGINVGSTVIYMAWAEAPSFNLYGAQSNAR